LAKTNIFSGQQTIGNVLFMEKVIGPIIDFAAQHQTMMWMGAKTLLYSNKEF
jgi:hypothetical protein